MKNIIMTLMIVFFFSTINYAQDYSTSIGLRGGYSNGLTIKHFISKTTALEGILSSRWQGVEITGLYEIQAPFEENARLNWYYGFGGHLGFWNGNHTNWGNRETSYTVVGLDGIIGLEYNFTGIPFNISLDWKPTFNLFGYSGFWGDGGALSIRYVF